MRIVVDAAAGASELDDPDDLERFSVEVRGDGDLSAALAPFGRIEGEHAWIAVDMVRASARDRVGEGWHERFEAMLAHAATKGWLDESGEHLRAHIEHT
jgi:hypothetical protein